MLTEIIGNLRISMQTKQNTLKYKKNKNNYQTIFENLKNKSKK